MAPVRRGIPGGLGSNVQAGLPMDECLPATIRQPATKPAGQAARGRALGRCTRREGGMRAAPLSALSHASALPGAPRPAVRLAAMDVDLMDRTVARLHAQEPTLA